MDLDLQNQIHTFDLIVQLLIDRNLLPKIASRVDVFKQRSNEKVDSLLSHQNSLSTLLFLLVHVDQCEFRNAQWDEEALLLDLQQLTEPVFEYSISLLFLDFGVL